MAYDRYVAWQVRVRVGDRANLTAVVDRLREAGVRCARRWSSVVIGAYTEDEAKHLAQELRQLDLPPSTIEVGRTSRIWAALSDVPPWP
jgi:uncharacterized Fe-S cluster-containing radical SAM superfamily protein